MNKSLIVGLLWILTAVIFFAIYYISKDTTFMPICLMAACAGVFFMVSKKK